MGFKRFSVLLTLRLALVFVSTLALTLLVINPGYHAASILVTGIVLAQVMEIVRFVRLTNDELTRFLDALRYGDFGQKFDYSGRGAGFGELGRALSDIIERFRTFRGQQEEDFKHLKALVEHVPVPLMSVYSDGQISLHNNSARRLFGNAHVARLSDLTPFGEDFKKLVTILEPGERRLVTFRADEMEQTLTIAATQVMIAGRRERLISLQDIQSELDVTQLQAWQDLVRVLTHEIMKSITPVASLAKTSVDLVEDAIGKADGQVELVEELEDVRDAVDTVARRSDSLMHFVQSYRRLTRLPPPEKEHIRVATLIDGALKVASVNWAEKDLTPEVVLSSDSLEISADRDMLEQILINLLKNAEQALEGVEQPKIQIRGRLNRRGHVVIEVSDNGPGIAKDLATKVFVPFYTTKREGSGVGLALTRQVMIAHGGSVTVSETEGGGATFILTF